MSYEEILVAAIHYFGAREQENLAQEECAELIQAISKKHRGHKHNISEEIADVEIMLAQLKLINKCSADVEAIKVRKVRRLLDLVNEKEGGK